MVQEMTAAINSTPAMAAMAAMAALVAVSAKTKSLTAHFVKATQ
jgi:hypothetical protein